MPVMLCIDLVSSEKKKKKKKNKTNKQTKKNIKKKVFCNILLFCFDLVDIGMEIMPRVFVFEKRKSFKAGTNGSKMIKFSANCLKIVAMCRSRCDQGISKRTCFHVVI